VSVADAVTAVNEDGFAETAPSGPVYWLAGIPTRSGPRAASSRHPAHLLRGPLEQPGAVERPERLARPLISRSMMSVDRQP
jgi:hypothetical protein